MTSLRITSGPQLGKTFELARGIATLGRDQTNSIQILDFEISRRHAEFHIRGDENWLFDLGSSNGTFVNGRRLESPCRLASGDSIRIGQTNCIFESILSDGTDRKIVSGQDTIQNIAKTQALGNDSADLDSHMANWIARAKSNIQVMYQTALATSNHQDTDALVERILDLVFTWCSANRASVLLVDESLNTAIPKTFRHVSKNKIDTSPFNINQQVIEYVLANREGVLTSNILNDRRFAIAADAELDALEVICVPIRGRSGVRGLIYVDQYSENADDSNYSLDEDQFKLLIAIGHQAAVAIENADYYQTLLASERMSAVGNVMSSLSHHIKNILQSINGGTHLIEDGLKKRNYELVQNGWQIVQRNQDTMSNLVMDMISFSRDRNPNFKQSNLNEIIKSCVSMVERRAAYCGVEVIVHEEDQVEDIWIDRDNIHRAVHNVLTTSINSCRDNSGGRVEIRISQPEDDFVRIVVEDTGVQLTDDELNTLFDPLAINEFSYRTGIHMAVSKKIVMQHQGTIEAENNPENELGSCFTIHLPMDPLENLQPNVAEDESVVPEQSV